MASSYADTLKIAATMAGMTAVTVRLLTYPATAAMCGVKLGEKGESPKDFFFADIRDAVAGQMQQEKDAKDTAAAMDTLAQLAVDKGIKEVMAGLLPPENQKLLLEIAAGKIVTPK